MSNRPSWRSTLHLSLPARVQQRVQRWSGAGPRASAATPQRRAMREPTPRLPMTIFALVLGTVLGVILAVPSSTTATVAKGAPSPVSFSAPRSITYESEVRTRRARDEAASNPANIVATPDDKTPGQQRELLLRTLESISMLRRNEAISVEDKADSIMALPSFPVSSTLALDIAGFSADRWQVVVDESRRLYDQIWLNRTNGLNDIEIANVRDRVLPYIVSPTLSEAERTAVVSLVGTFLKPNRLINVEATELRRQAARAAVKPVLVTIERGEQILSAGDVVDDEAYEKLTKLGLVFGAGGGIAIAQKFVLGLLVAWLLAMFLYRYHGRLSRNQRALMVIGSVVAVTVLGGRFINTVWQFAPYAFPLAALSIILTILFDGRIGLVATLLVAPLIGINAEQSIGVTLTLALGGAAGIFLAQRAIRTFSFIYVALAVALMTLLCGFVFWLDPFVGPSAMLYVPLFSLFNGVQSIILALGTYHVLGRMANVVTPLQLMELSHPNQVLLHRLMHEAPGTYHHSMVVSSLAEMAAENIGADPLLARVGAYYHDVGKMIRPYFFTDNQHERSNVHDDLDARTSASIIIDHVREGAKMAREHNLPEQVIDFITQHHGTNLVSYFYQRALQQEEDDPDIEEFRYPGPKPQTRETGILMLADGVEATVRARSQSGKLRPIRPDDEPDQNGMQSIAEVVEQIVNERVRSGQLDECPLTLRDIAVIKESFVKTLQGIYHPRVDYPRDT